MSDHLPECDYERQDYRGNDNRVCYCSRLRACEQRVREDERDNCWSAVAEIYPDEFFNGVKTSWWIEKEAALAAIYALKEKS